MSLTPNTYYPLMWRGNGANTPSAFGPAPEDTPFFDHLISSSQQLSILVDNLLTIFRYVYPEDCSTGHRNALCFGNECRSSLILACTEVEAQWRCVLDANHAIKTGQICTTKDYVRLLPAMRLKDYVLKLARFPRYPLIKPFATWAVGNATKSLPWYDAYNLTKHDRSGNFAEANLSNTISAVAACLVMHVAEFGCAHANRFSELFAIEEFPQWQTADIYNLSDPTLYQPIDFPF